MPAAIPRATLRGRWQRVEFEVVKADLLDPSTLRSALEGAHGAFVVTNFWDPAQMPRETKIGTAAVQAARDAGVKHLIWSTLPDSEKLTGGRVKVAHFTGKARVDAAVRAAEFARHTFVIAPMYFQNFLTMMAPQPLPNGGSGWAVPIDPAARVMHAGDVTEVGRAVGRARSWRRATQRQLPGRMQRRLLLQRFCRHTGCRGRSDAAARQACPVARLPSPGHR